MKPKLVVKCKFCDWRCPQWRTLKSGKRRDGYITLKGHIEDAHPDELERIEHWLDNIEDQREVES